MHDCMQLLFSKFNIVYFLHELKARKFSFTQLINPLAILKFDFLVRTRAHLYLGQLFRILFIILSIPRKGWLQKDISIDCIYLLTCPCKNTGSILKKSRKRKAKL